MHANGNIYDREGFLISEGSELPAANPEGSQMDCTTLSTATTVASILRRGMTRLDSDIITDGIPDTTQGLNKSLLRIVLSGCVATSVYIPNSQDVVYVAQVGDCGAVLGRYLGDLTPEAPPTALFPTPPTKSFPTAFKRNQWSAEFLVRSHTAHNAADVGRLQAQHPIHEADLLISEDRLLGAGQQWALAADAVSSSQQHPLSATLWFACVTLIVTIQPSPLVVFEGELMPLRAFGDIRYKLPASTLKNIARLLGMPPNYPVCPRFYHSPPYLVPTPQVVCRKLTPGRDRFIVLATDGLWDMLSPEEAVQVVAQHLIDYKGDLLKEGLRIFDAILRSISQMLQVPVQPFGKVVRYTSGQLGTRINELAIRRRDILSLVFAQAMDCDHPFSWDAIEVVAMANTKQALRPNDPSHAGPRDTAASRLIRTALGGESMDTSRIAMHLSVPANVARFYRDDITVLVIYPNM
ncbi:unnamed protein product [Schistocephalus solidus]|uniref:PPM-type phosphatase domain-containing protein n=1 Tax=Schistocephalus solidus TaxID=70667 RepID=A0A183T7R6_SCHSO|nr:unnamed protein product [Schistocephalus solidus]